MLAPEASLCLALPLLLAPMPAGRAWKPKGWPRRRTERGEEALPILLWKTCTRQTPAQSLHQHQGPVVLPDAFSSVVDLPSPSLGSVCLTSLAYFNVLIGPSLCKGTYLSLCALSKQSAYTLSPRFPQNLPLLSSDPRLPHALPLLGKATDHSHGVTLSCDCSLLSDARPRIRGKDKDSYWSPSDWDGCWARGGLNSSSSFIIYEWSDFRQTI